MKAYLCALLLAFCATSPIQAELQSRVDLPKKIGDKALIKVTFQNTYAEPVKSARATVFLMGDKGKVAGFKTAWVIGGTAERKPLDPKAKAEYNFVITTKEPFNEAQLVLNRIVLESGKLITPTKRVPIPEPDN